MRGRIESCAAVFASLWERRLTTAQGQDIFIVFRVLVKMWIISEDKTRLLFMVGSEGGMETEKEIEYLLAAAS